MKVAELGEFGLIDLLAGMMAATRNDRLPPYQKLIIGIGDDAAAWRGDPVQLATVDSLIEGVHFTLDTITWAELGWKALAVNLSDIAAMGGAPEYALVALALPGATEVDDVRALYAGMLELANQSGVAVIGGNTCQAPEVSVTITVIGGSPRGKLLRRDGARPGDLIAVTGYLGSAGAGFRMLKDRLPFKTDDAAYLSDAFRRPRPRIAEGRILAGRGVAAAIDISDGLFADLKHICQASGVGARVETTRLPIHPTVRENFGTRAVGLALGGGEDYELIFTASAKIMDKLRDEVPLTVIGEITAENPGEVTLTGADNRPITLPETGWDHFKKG